MEGDFLYVVVRSLSSFRMLEEKLRGGLTCWEEGSWGRCLESVTAWSLTQPDLI